MLDSDESLSQSPCVYWEADAVSDTTVLEWDRNLVGFMHAWTSDIIGPTLLVDGMITLLTGGFWEISSLDIKLGYAWNNFVPYIVHYLQSFIIHHCEDIIRGTATRLTEK